MIGSLFSISLLVFGPKRHLKLHSFVLWKVPLAELLLSSLEVMERGLDVVVSSKVGDGVVDWVWFWKVLLEGWDPLVAQSLLRLGDGSPGSGDIAIHSEVWNSCVCPLRCFSTSTFGTPAFGVEPHYPE